MRLLSKPGELLVYIIWQGDGAAYFPGHGKHFGERLSSISADSDGFTDDAANAPSKATVEQASHIPAKERIECLGIALTGHLHTIPFTRHLC